MKRIFIENLQKQQGYSIAGDLIAVAFFLFMGIVSVVYYFMPVIVWAGLSSLVAFWAVLKKKPKPWLWGVVAGLIIGLPQLLDVILTPIVSAYYCKAEAGTWVYKTIPEWQAENPNTPITNVHSKARDNFSRHTTNSQEKFFYDRLQVEISKYEPNSMFPFSIVEERLIDIKNKNILAKRVLTISGDDKNEVNRTHPNPWHISLKPLGLVLIHSSCTPDTRGKAWFSFISAIYKTAPYLDLVKQNEEKKDKELNQLYTDLIEIHKQALQYSKDKQKYIHEHKQWEEKASITCHSNVACLSHQYRTRIKTLRAQINQN